MKDFKEISIHWESVEEELSAFEKLLSEYQDLSESSDILPFFRKSPNLSAFIGKIYFPTLSNINRISYEFDFFGDFKADLAIGDSMKESYAFIEFEDGKHNSIFKTSKAKYQKDWSNRFEHGYSQIIDWFWKLDDLKQTTSFKEKFNSNDIDFRGILIIGRDSYLSDYDFKRFKWRSKHTIIQSKSIHCITYDELLEDLKQQIKFLQFIK
ncbi:Shedu immune nuclease family protein [Arcicella rigui]|uniref:Shedu immune nuclease family protein n=1 Tax=Arcicella rigui TaxID=797020 RepID=A0ABU5QFG3_9BACT|nr:Shedu immune nuclease family protein [Arcicella rigui]MEA5141600.1 Shedu immune nuclease family protein [Arcicella rigui]